MRVACFLVHNLFLKRACLASIVHQEASHPVATLLGFFEYYFDPLFIML